MKIKCQFTKSNFVIEEWCHISHVFVHMNTWCLHANFLSNKNEENVTKYQIPCFKYTQKKKKKKKRVNKWHKTIRGLG